MNAYRAEMHNLALALVELVRDGAAVSEPDLPVALTGHAAVLDLATQMHRDLVSTAWTGDGIPLRGLEIHPVAMLGRSLRNHPRFADAAPTDVLGPPRSTVPGGLWQSVAASATITTSYWQQHVAQGVPQGDAAWAELADAAAISEAIAVTDLDLVGSLAGAGRVRDAAKMQRAALEGLRITAREAGFTALGGPLQIRDHPIGASNIPMPVRQVRDLPEAFNRLNRMLLEAESLTPVHAGRVARVLAEAALLSGSSLDGDRAGPLVAALRDHADRLSLAAASITDVVCLHGADRRVVEQAGLIHLWLEQRTRKKLPLTQADAVEVAQLLPSLTRRLSDATSAQASQKNWVLVERQGYRGVARPPGEQPGGLGYMFRWAAFSAENVERALADVVTAAPIATARMVLSQALEQARYPKDRPLNPGVPLHGQPTNPSRRRR